MGLASPYRTFRTTVATRHPVGGHRAPFSHPHQTMRFKHASGASPALVLVDGRDRTSAPTPSASHHPTTHLIQRWSRVIPWGGLLCPHPMRCPIKTIRCLFLLILAVADPCPLFAGGGNDFHIAVVCPLSSRNAANGKSAMEGHAFISIR